MALKIYNFLSAVQQIKLFRSKKHKNTIKQIIFLKNKIKQIKLMENSEIIKSIEIENPDLENQNFEKKLEILSSPRKSN